MRNMIGQMKTLGCENNKEHLPPKPRGADGEEGCKEQWDMVQTPFGSICIILIKECYEPSPLAFGLFSLFSTAPAIVFIV